MQNLRVYIFLQCFLVVSASDDYYDDSKENIGNMDDILPKDDKEEIEPSHIEDDEIESIDMKNSEEREDNGLLISKTNVHHNNITSTENTIMDDESFYAIFITEFLDSIGNISNEELRQQKLNELTNQLEALSTVDVFFSILFYIIKFADKTVIQLDNKKILIGDLVMVQFKDKFIECYIEDKKFIIIFTEDKYKCFIKFVDVLATVYAQGQIFLQLKEFLVTINLPQYIKKQHIQPPINLIPSNPVVKNKKTKGKKPKNKNTKIIDNKNSKKNVPNTNKTPRVKNNIKNSKAPKKALKTPIKEKKTLTKNFKK